MVLLVTKSLWNLRIVHMKLEDHWSCSSPERLSHCKLMRFKLQVNLITTLSLGSMKTDRVISEPCYNEVIYNRHIAK